METKEKDAVIAGIENVEAIKDFFKEWWTAAQLYETAAKACSALAFYQAQGSISNVDAKTLAMLMEQHLMMIDLLKKFEGKEADHE